jgi:hypothetical protein
MLGMISIIIIQPDDNAQAVNKMIASFQHGSAAGLGIPFPEKETA